MSEEKLKGRHQCGKRSADTDVVSIDNITYGYYPPMWMNYTSHDSVLLQVVIGGINVDFVAKGETKTLRVRTSLLRIAVLSHTLANSHLVVPSSLGRPTQDVCSSHLEALVATSLVRFYTITSHVHSISPDLNFAACFFFFKTP